MEEWRAVKGDSRYEVSDLGKVRNASTKKVFAATPRKNGHLALNGENSPKGESHKISKLTEKAVY